MCPQLLKLALDDSHMNLRKNGEYLIDRSLLPSNPMISYRVLGSKVHMVLTGVKCTAAKVVAHERKNGRDNEDFSKSTDCTKL